MNGGQHALRTTAQGVQVVRITVPSIKGGWPLAASGAYNTAYMAGKGGQQTTVNWPKKPHTNKTTGHWNTIVKKVKSLQSAGSYRALYVNQGLRRLVKHITVNRRPDIVGDRWNRRVDQFEVPSRTDTPRKLIDRMKDNQKNIGRRAGSINIVPIY